MEWILIKEDQKDEWNAIVAYNKKLYEEELKNNKLKELEIKRRIREDLDNQIRQKLRKTHEEIIQIIFMRFTDY